MKSGLHRVCNYTLAHKRKHVSGLTWHWNSVFTLFLPSKKLAQQSSPAQPSPAQSSVSASCSFSAIVGILTCLCSQPASCRVEVLLTLKILKLTKGTRTTPERGTEISFVCVLCLCVSLLTKWNLLQDLGCSDPFCRWIQFVSSLLNFIQDDSRKCVGMSSSDESDAGRRTSSEEDDEKIDEEKEEIASQSQEDSPSPSPVRSQKLSARSKSASLNALAFPISRVRRLVKSEGDMQWVGVEAGFLIAKAAELFLEKFVEEAFESMTGDDRTTLHYKDLASHVSSAERMDFLADLVPEMVTASNALSVNAHADR